MPLHIGRMVRYRFEQLPRTCTVTWLARELNCDRTNIYKIFSRSTLDTDLLIRLSRVLHYDFFEEISRKIDV